jgi:alpha-tubulin suppressor-like RCC1 family protein
MELVKRLDAFRRTERDLPTCPVKWATLPLRDKVFVDGHHVDAGKDNDSGDNDDDDDDDDGVNMMSSDAFMFSSVSSIFDFESSVDQKLLDKVLLPALLNAKGSRVQEEVGSSRRHKRLCHPWAEADVVGRTALHYLASWGSSRLMHALVQLAQDATATVNVKHKQSRSNQREQLRLATQALLRTVNQRDVESGWTALHRAFYHGRLYVALLLLHTESVDLSVKDHDGRIAFDILREMLPLTTPRGLPYPLVDNTDSASQPHQKNAQLWLMEDIDESSKDSSSGTKSRKFSGTSSTMGQKIVRNLLYTWGSNDNYLLGHAGQNDRARPDRTPLHRHTLHHDGHSTASYNMYSQRDPALFIREVAMSKLHTLVVTEAGLDSTRTQRHSHTRTADGEYGVGNLLTCGFGRGGRLGNSEATRFVLEPVQGIPDPVITAACGRDHTVAVTSRYEVYTFGNGAWGQLGYQVSCNSTNQRSGAAEHREQIKNDQIQLTPRRVLGALDGVSIIGCAASTWHTVVHTGVSVFTFGKDAGQLGYRTDSGRQMSPRCVPLHLPSGSKIVQVAATERATAVLFSNGDLCILASYQQQKIILPDDRLPTKMSAYVPASELHVSIVKLTSDTELHLGMISSWGDTYLLPTTFPTSGNEAGRDNGSVGRFSRYVRRVWTSNTRRMDAVDFAIGHDASVLVCTRGGQVFCGKKRRSHSAASSGTSSGSGHAGSGKNNHYTFERVPGIHQAIMVRAGVSGSMAAVRLEVLPPIFPKTTPRLATDIAGAIVGQEHEDQDRQTLTKKLVQELCKDAPGLMPGDGLGDIAIHVGSTRFFGHSAILSARSQFFKRMLYEQKPFVKRRNMITLSFEPKSNDTSMANVRFSGCGPREVASVLIYIYIDDCPLSELDTDIMIELAGMLNLPGLTAKAQLSTKSQHLHTLNNAMLNMFTSACNISQEAGRLIRSRECTQQHRSDCGFVDVVLNLADCCVFAHRVVLIHR